MFGTRSCSLCRSTDVERVFEAQDYRYEAGERTYPIVRCRRCGLIRLDLDGIRYEAAYPAQFNDRRLQRIEEGQDGRGASRTARRARHRSRERQVVFTRRARLAAVGGGRILDIGCGAGDFLKSLPSPRWQKFGIEVTVDVCRRVAAGTGLPVGNADGARLPFRDGTFDVITAWGAIEHLSDPVACMREMHRTLRPGGKVVFFVPDASGPLFRLFRIVDPPRHLYHFTPDTSREAMRAAGFSDRLITVYAGAGENMNGLYHAFKAFARRFSVRARLRREEGRWAASWGLMALHRFVKLLGFVLHPLTGLVAPHGFSDAIVLEAVKEGGRPGSSASGPHPAR